MKRRTFLLGLGSLAALAATAGAAEARMHAPYRGHRIVPQASAPLDTFATPSGAYSFRKLRSAYTGPALRIRRASDNAELDINFLGFVPGLGAPLDIAQANSHCAATSCFIRTWYDQSGGGRHAVQATAGNQPGLQLNCLAGLPCARVTLGTGQLLQYGGVTPTSPISLSAVSRQAVRGTQACGYLYVGAGNQIVQHPTLDVFQMSNGGSTLAMAAAALGWHSHLGVMNAAASVVRVDGTETPGTLAMAVGAGNIAVNYGGSGATCDATEVVFWDAYALTAAERTALQTNQKNFWGTP